MMNSFYIGSTGRGVQDIIIMGWHIIIIIIEQERTFIQFITTLAVIQTYIREGIIILLKLVIFAMDQKNIKTNNLNYQLDQQD